MNPLKLIVVTLFLGLTGCGGQNSSLLKEQGKVSDGGDSVHSERTPVTNTTEIQSVTRRAKAGAHALLANIKSENFPLFVKLSIAVDLIHFRLFFREDMDSKIAYIDEDPKLRHTIEFHYGKEYLAKVQNDKELLEDDLTIGSVVFTESISATELAQHKNFPTQITAYLWACRSSRNRDKTLEGMQRLLSLDNLSEKVALSRAAKLKFETIPTKRLRAYLKFSITHHDKKLEQSILAELNGRKYKRDDHH